MSTITNPEFRGLLAVARQEGLDMKPVLLRVLTDLYVGTPKHSAAETAQFLEFSRTLIPCVDKDTALVVACKLCAYPGTPLAIGEALLARGDDAARIVLADAPWLPRRHSEAAAMHDDRILAAAVAARADLDADLARLLLERRDSLIDVTLAGNTAARLPGDVLAELLARSRTEAAISQALLSRPDLSGAERAALFLEADKAGRKAIIAHAEREAGLSGRHLAPTEAADELTMALESAALARDNRAFRAVLALGLGVAGERLERLFADRSGEGIALALVALGVPDPVAARIFMFRDPMIGHSTERCFALVDLSRHVSPLAAQAIIAAILGPRTSTQAPQRGAVHVPASDPAERSRPSPPVATPQAAFRRLAAG